MARPRPRRAQRPSPTVRVARVAVPAVAAGALIAGIAVTAWPQSASLQAVPAANPSTSLDAARAGQADRADRDLTRTPLAPSAGPSASETSAANEKTAEKKAGEKDAAEKKAGEKDAAKKADREEGRREEGRREESR